MTSLFKAALPACALAIALGGLAPAQSVTTQAQPRTACAQGFSNAGQYAGGAPFDYECRTPFIRCPSKAGYIVGIEPAPPVQSASGLRLRYHCTYQKQPG